MWFLRPRSAPSTPSTPTKPRQPPPGLSWRSADWFIVSSVAIAVFTEIFLYAVVVPVLPFALSSRAGVASDDIQQWTSTLLAVYAAFLLAVSPVAGWVADRTSTRRGPLLASLVTFAGATLLLMFGRSIGALIAGRALQGASAAAVWSIGLALLVDTVGVDRIGEAMGYVSLSMSLGVFCGPLLGGLVYEKAGYYAVFYMAIGVIVLDIILRVLIVEKRVARQWVGGDGTEADSQAPQSHDIEKNKRPQSSSVANTSAVAVSGMVVKQEQTVPATVPHVNGTKDKPDPRSVESAGSEVPPPTITITSEDAAPNQATSGTIGSQNDSNIAAAHPLRPIKALSNRPAVFTLLSSRRLLVALWGMLVVSTINTSFDSVIPLRVNSVFGWDSVGAGLIFLAIIVPSLINPLVGKLVDRFGARLITTLGFTLVCPALVCLRFVDHDSLGQKVLLCALLACAGGAISLLMVPVLAEMTHCIESTQNERPERFGSRGAFAQGYGLMNASYALGTLIGPIWSGFALESVGWGTMTWSLGLFAGITSVPMFLCMGGWIGRRGWRNELLRPARAMTRKDDARDEE